MGEHINAINRDGLGDVLIGEGGVGEVDDFGGVD